VVGGCLSVSCWACREAEEGGRMKWWQDDRWRKRGLNRKRRMREEWRPELCFSRSHQPTDSLHFRANTHFNTTNLSGAHNAATSMIQTSALYLINSVNSTVQIKMTLNQQKESWKLKTFPVFLFVVIEICKTQCSFTSPLSGFSLEL